MRKTILLALAILGGAAASAPAGEGDGRQEMLRRLDTVRVDVAFDRTSLAEALGFVGHAARLNIVVDPEVTARMANEPWTVTMKVRDLRVKSVLKLMLHPRQLTAVYREGVLVVQPCDKAIPEVTLQLYDVRDLLTRIDDFPGPRVELAQAGTTSPSLNCMFILEPEYPRMSGDFIAELVKECTGGASWNNNPNAGMTLGNGFLAVTQTRKVHEEIRQFLSKLQQYR